MPSLYRDPDCVLTPEREEAIVALLSEGSRQTLAVAQHLHVSYNSARLLMHKMVDRGLVRKRMWRESMKHPLVQKWILRENDKRAALRRDPEAYFAALLGKDAYA